MASGLAASLLLSSCAAEAPPEAGQELLALSFEEGSPGPVSEKQARQEWSSESASLASFSLFPGDSMSIEEEAGNRYLVRSFEKGTYNASHEKRRNLAVLTWDLDEAYDEVHISYRIRASESFGAGRGGKLPGLCGGTCPTGGEATDDEDGDAVGWSARNMWVSSGAFSQYVYLPGQDSDYGDGIVYRRGQDQPVLTDARWHQVNFVVRMNTPGEADGELTGWIDGTRYLKEDGLRFRDKESDGVEKVLFSNFYGGHDKSWAAPEDAELYFDDLIVRVPAP